jgi:hypothetical protein
MSSTDKLLSETAFSAAVEKTCEKQKRGERREFLRQKLHAAIQNKRPVQVVRPRHWRHVETDIDELFNQLRVVKPQSLYGRPPERLPILLDEAGRLQPLMNKGASGAKRQLEGWRESFQQMYPHYVNIKLMVPQGKPPELHRDVVTSIFQFLGSAEDVWAAARCCKSWLQASQMPHVWRGKTFTCIANLQLRMLKPQYWEFGALYGADHLVVDIQPDYRAEYPQWTGEAEAIAIMLRREQLPKLRSVTMHGPFPLVLGVLAKSTAVEKVIILPERKIRLSEPTNTPYGDIIQHTYIRSNLLRVTGDIGFIDERLAVLLNPNLKIAQLFSKDDLWSSSMSWYGYDYHDTKTAQVRTKLLSALRDRKVPLEHLELPLYSLSSQVPFYTVRFYNELFALLLDKQQRVKTVQLSIKATLDNFWVTIQTPLKCLEIALVDQQERDVQQEGGVSPINIHFVQHFLGQEEDVLESESQRRVMIYTVDYPSRERKDSTFLQSMRGEVRDSIAAIQKMGAGRVRLSIEGCPDFHKVLKELQNPNVKQG